ncbi:hypothetical protein [Salinibacter ruber]|uniref:hypothetical protein n=1 Tax=Salinibacter ruber TaxID=146919 RepID=UPI0013C326EF|nr:hypothetical protein [Salinibacter ruber]MCS4100686.1 hypothetical protein [Salinibacter ruber]
MDPVVISAISAGAAVLSTLISLAAVFVSGKSLSRNTEMFQRQGVIDLHMAWQGVNELDLENEEDVVTPDVVKAVNALDLTASLWNHDVIDRSILYQSYWSTYQDLYDSLYSSETLIPGLDRRARDLITSEMTRAYEEMKDTDIDRVRQTNLKDSWIPGK